MTDHSDPSDHALAAFYGSGPGPDVEVQVNIFRLKRSTHAPRLALPIFFALTVNGYEHRCVSVRVSWLSVTPVVVGSLF